MTRRLVELRKLMPSLPSKDPPWITWGIILGGLMMCSPLWIPLFPYVLMALRSFQDLGSETPAAPTNEFSGHIRISFYLTLAGLCFSPVGAAVLIASLWFRRKAKTKKPRGERLT